MRYAWLAGNRGFRQPRSRAKATRPRSGEKQQMAKLQLSFACGLYDRMQPLYTGEVKVEGIDLNFIAIDQPRPIFDRMAGDEEFDVAEFSSWSSCSASPASSARSSPFRSFPRVRFATASLPSTARPASRPPRTSRASAWASLCSP